MENNEILDPIEKYKFELKDKVHNNATKFFDALKDKAQIDTNKNLEVNKKIEKLSSEKDNASQILSGLKTKKGFLVFLSLVALCAWLIYLIACKVKDNNNTTYDYRGYPIYTESCMNTVVLILLIIILGGLGIFGLVMISKKITPVIRDYESKISDMEAEINRLIKEGYAQLKPLFNLFDYDIPNQVIREVVPLIQLDANFNVDRFMMLNEKYGLGDNTDKNCSTLLVQSGEILGNPFVLCKTNNTFMGSETYTGYKTISWTTTTYDSEGHAHTHYHTETLTASITEPCPRYFKDTCLIYGNEAAPKLKFSRKPQECSNYDEVDLDRYLKKFDKKLDKMVKKDIDPSDNSQFTRLANTKFEALFNALDRNDEKEFRLLFTPLAQTSMCKLLRSNEGFGDDFSFKKVNKLNYIRSNHSQIFDYELDPTDLNHYDYRVVKQAFIDRCDSYFKNIFFDLAPLLSIPLYQQYKTLDFIYGKDFVSNVTTYEHEVMANSYHNDEFKPKKCDTEYILKTSLIKKDKDYDRIVVNAYGYEKVPMHTTKSVYGGDGHWHDVHINYFIYNTVSKSTHMNVRNASIDTENKSKYNLSKVLLKRDILSYISKDIDSNLEQNISEIIKSIKEDK